MTTTALGLTMALEMTKLELTMIFKSMATLELDQ